MFRTIGFAAGINRRFSSWVYLTTLAALCLLPLLPEICLWIKHYDDLKALRSIAYYELIVSVVLWWPALVLPLRAARLWTVTIGTTTAIATAIVGFQAVTVGARWDTTAHSAVLETNSFEAWGFVRTFASFNTVLWLAGVLGAFTSCMVLNLRSAAPARKRALLILAVAAVLSSYGIRNIIVYGGNPVHESHVTNDLTLRLLEPGINAYHPLVRLAVTHWNWSVTHAYRLKVLKEMNEHLAELSGAVPVEGATPPRIMLIVIGESASRRHWSLYGYHRDTTPRLAALGDDLVVFRDVVSHTVGTLTEIQGMLCAQGSYLPVLSLFSAAGYRTHWFSAQLDQGPNDVKLAALVQRCDERVFLNGAYDENLVPLVRHAVAEPGKHVIVVNLFGSHVRYEDRYPTTFDVFKGSGEKGRRLAAYDNSIRYTDYVLARFIAVLRERQEASCFLYVSDHAEDVYDTNPNEYLFRSDSVATDAMYEVPCVMWFSHEYRAGNPELVENAVRATYAPFQTLGLYHTLVDLARLRHPIADSRMSLVSHDYHAGSRIVGAMNRIYHASSSGESGNAAGTTTQEPRRAQ